MPIERPEWVRKRISGDLLACGQKRVGPVLDVHRLRTVCSDARCPNLPECFAEGSATFIIMGPNCSRSCRFCSVPSGNPEPLDPTEPGRVAGAASALKLKHVVITTVTRDDLPDGGASHVAQTIASVRSAMPEATIEALVSDFQGDEASLKTVLEARPEVLNHNVETVPRLTPEVRPQADFDRSLSLLASVKRLAPEVLSKSGLMVGLGESVDEVVDVLRVLRDVGCDIVTVGQYLAPTALHLPVKRFWTPEEFEEIERNGEDLGIPALFAGCFVRSSWRAIAAMKLARERRGR